MTTTVPSDAAPAAPMSLVARFFGILTSPRQTFENVAASPRWFGMLAVTVLTAMALVGGFLFTQVGQDAWLQTVTTARQLSPEQLQAVERMAKYAGYFAGVQMLIILPLILVIASAIFFAVFNAALGGEASFKQVFAVVVHTGPVGVVSQLFSMPLNYYRGTMTSAANLGVLLPMLDESSFAAHFASTIDLFLVWQVLMVAIGLGVLYRRRTQPIAITLFGLYAAIAVIIAVIKSRAGGA